MDLIDTQTSRVLAKALDGISKRHMAIASNVANADTPGYRGLDVNFEANLKQAIQAENADEAQQRFLPPDSLKTNNPKHINPHPVAGSVGDSQAAIERTEFMYRFDKNGVDIEREMAKLAKNAGRYSAVAKLEARTFSGLKSVIKGGGS